MVYKYNSIYKIKKFLFCLTFLLLLIVSTSVSSSGHPVDNQSETISNTTSSQISLDYVSHGAISIDGNSAFDTMASNEGWTGTGTVGDPYIIEGLSITLSSYGSAFYVINSNVHFVFRNNLIDGTAPLSDSYGSNGGIYLGNTQNANITGNIIQNFQYGNYLEQADNNLFFQNDVSANAYGFYSHQSNINTFESNLVYSNTNTGVYFVHSSNNTLLGNSVYDNTNKGIRLDYDTHGIQAYYSENNTISKNFVYNNGDQIFVQNAYNTLIDNNTVSGGFYGFAVSGPGSIVSNNIAYSTYYGISADREDLTIVNNHLYSNLQFGIIVNYRNNITINNNELNNNPIGLYMFSSKFSNVEGNWVYNNTQFGIQMSSTSNDTIVSNIVQENKVGVEFDGISSNNTIVQNEVFDNSLYGFYLGNTTNPQTQSCNDNTLENNKVYGNQIGIYLNSSDGNILNFNTVRDNIQDGLSIYGESSDNELMRNLFKNNGNYGINVNGSYNNMLRNDFINNANMISQAQDSGSNNTFTYNYWNDHSNIDSDGNNYADQAYVIAGLENNTDPLPEIIQNTIHHISLPEFLNPTGGEQFASVVIVQWTSAYDNFDHQLTYLLEISPDNGANWNLLANDIHSTSYQWNVSSELNGIYLLRITAADNLGGSVSVVSKEFTIANHYMSAPEITYPNGGETLSGTIEISWDEATDSLTHAITYDLYYSGNSGETWTSITKLVSGNRYQWDTTSVPQGDTYLIWVIASDNVNTTTSDKSNAIFSINQPQPKNGNEDKGIASVLSNLPTLGIFEWSWILLTIATIKKVKLKNRIK